MIMFQADLSSTSYCCGFLEAGNFADEWGHDHKASTPEALVEALLKSANGRPLMFNFVKRRNYKDELVDKYEANELREYVRKFKGVKHIREFRNPGTNNMIDSYVIFGKLVSKRERTEKEIDDDSIIHYD